MWAIFSFALFATAAASSDMRLYSYQYHMKDLLNDMIQYVVSPAFDQSVKNGCQRYADKEAYDNFTSVKNNLIQDITASTALEAAKALRDGETQKSLNIYCTLSQKIKTNMANLWSALRPCFMPETREDQEYYLKSLYSLLDYLCFNDSLRVKSFTRNGGEECINEKQNELLQCKRDSYSSVMEEERENGIDSDEARGNEITTSYIPRYCREKSKLLTCVKKELDQCPSRTTSAFVVGLLHIAYKPSCYKYKL